MLPRPLETDSECGLALQAGHSHQPAICWSFKAPGETVVFGAWGAGPGGQVTRVQVPLLRLQRQVLGSPSGDGQWASPGRGHPRASVMRGRDVRRWKNHLGDVLDCP